MKKLSFLLFIIISLSFLLSAYAHPGRLDSDGGHYNRDTGEYHYHDGSSAGRNNNSDSDDYTYSHFEGPTKKYNSSSDYNTTKPTNNSDSLSLGSITFIIIIVSLVGIGAFFTILTLSEKIKPNKTNTQTIQPINNSVDDILAQIQSKRIKRYRELTELHKEEISKESTNTKNHLEQIAGFPEGFYINGFVLNDTKSNEAFGRATAYINNQDKTLHLFHNCNNATTPVNMLFDTYEMKNFKLCETCKKSGKYDFYLNYEIWYTKYMKMKIAADNNDYENI